MKERFLLLRDTWNGERWFKAGKILTRDQAKEHLKVPLVDLDQYQGWIEKIEQKEEELTIPKRR
jgi:hypothetical protein